MCLKKIDIMLQGRSPQNISGNDLMRADAFTSAIKTDWRESGAIARMEIDKSLYMCCNIYAHTYTSDDEARLRVYLKNFGIPHVRQDAYYVV